MYNIKRKRNVVDNIFLGYRYGSYYMKRAYCMLEEDFWRLYNLLLPYMPPRKEKKGGIKILVPLMVLSHLVVDLARQYVILQVGVPLI